MATIKSMVGRRGRRGVWIGTLATLALLVGGCVTQPPPATVVELVNTTALDVQPNFHASGSATDAAGLFVAANRRTDFTDRAFPELRGGETATLTLDCEEIAALGVDAPVMFDATLLEVTESSDQILLLRDTSFECGATIRFVYFTEDGVFRVRRE